MDHQLQIGGGDLLLIGIQAAVDHLQQLRLVQGDQRRPLIAEAVPQRGGGEGHAGLRLHPLGQLRKGQDIAHRQVGLYILREDLHQGGQLQEGSGLKALLRRRLQEILLDHQPAHIPPGVAAVVVLPVADHLHGIVPVQQAQARLLVDMQVLIGVVIVHVEGDLEFHAADGVHQLADGLPLHHHIEVGADARQLGHLILQGGHTVLHLGGLVLAPVVVIHRVQPLAGGAHVHHGVPGQIQALNGLGLGVIGQQQHGVSRAADHVPAHHQEGIYPLPPAAVGCGLSAGLLAGGGLVDHRLIRQVGHPDPPPQGQQPRQQHHDHAQQHPAADALLPVQPRPPKAQSCKGPLPFRRMVLSFSVLVLSHHVQSSIVTPAASSQSRAIKVLLWMGSPRSSISWMVVSTPSSSALSRSL